MTIYLLRTHCAIRRFRAPLTVADVCGLSLTGNTKDINTLTFSQSRFCTLRAVATNTTLAHAGQRDTMEAAAEAAQAQFSNMEAAMRQQLSQFRANASSDGSLTDDVMGPPTRPPAGLPDGCARASECTRPSECPPVCSACRLLSRRRLERALAQGVARLPRHSVGAGHRDA